MTRTLLLVTMVLLQVALWAQPRINITRLDADSGTSVDIDIKVENFTNLAGMQFTLRWNSSVISFGQLKNINNNLPDFSTQAFGTDSTSRGYMQVVWFDPGTKPNSLPDGSTIFTVSFDVIGAVGSSSEIYLDQVPLEIEFVDPDFNNVGFTQTRGRVNVVGTSGSSVTLIAGSPVGPTGDVVCVDISANGFNQIGAMQFTLKWNPAFMDFVEVQNTAALPGFGAGNTDPNNANGTLTVSWNAAAGVTLPAGARLFSACFRIKAPTGCTEVTFVNTPLQIEISDNTGQEKTVQTRAGEVCVDGEPDCIPDGFTFAIDHLTVQKDSFVCARLRVYDFEEIQSFNFSFEWDQTVLEGVGPDLASLGVLPDLTPAKFNTTQMAQGIASVVWFFDPVTLPDNTAIFSFCFKAIGDIGDCSAINITGNLSPIEVTNDNGDILPVYECPGEICISNAVPLVVTIVTTTQPTCPNSADGAVSVQVSGGKTPYRSFEWRNAGGQLVASTQNVSGLGAGTYTLVVTDDAGATASVQVILTAQNNITINGTVNHPKCHNGQDGSITLTISGNPGPTVQYAWPAPIGNVKDPSGLSAGTYVVTVTYGNGCSATQSFTVNNPQPITITPAIDNVNRSITVTPSGGSGGYTYTWSNTTQTTATITGLSLGTGYSVTVTDSNGCTGTGGPYFLSEGDDLQLDVVTSNFNGFGVSCNGSCNGTATVTPLSGTGPYTYQWSNNANPASLCAGTYTVTVTDATGKRGTATVTITAPARLVLLVTAFTPSTGSDGAATVSANGGTAPYTYVWNDPAATTGPSISGAGLEKYIVQVTDANGCTASRTIDFANEGGCYEHRKVITPNGDGLNDQFIITCLDLKPNRLDIFDRWGRLVYAAANYTNDWAGVGSDGAMLPDGGYFFVLSVTEDNGTERIVKGSVSLVRTLR